MNRNSSIASAAVSDDVLAEIYHTQHSEPSNKEDQTTDDSGWMQKREIHQVKNEAHRLIYVRQSFLEAYISRSLMISLLRILKNLIVFMCV